MDLLDIAYDSKKIQKLNQLKLDFVNTTFHFLFQFYCVRSVYH